MVDEKIGKGEIVMTKVEWKAGTMVYPVPPAMVSCGSMEKPNIITIAWTGIVNTEPAMTYISVRPSRHSYNLIKESGEFVINLTTRDLVKAADWCGVKTGAKFDKFKEMKLTPKKANHLDCPMIEESPVSIECRVKEIMELGTHHMFLAEILAVNIEDEYMDEDNRFRLDKAGLAAYAHGHYYGLGKELGKFGFSVMKKSTKKRKLRHSKGNKS
jgi:flavin reductase (DIM6/NTAB) family NADH-FMN oxidoreductase RutF